MACRYRLLSSHEFGFELGPHDRRQALVIDPVLRYSSYLGGQANDQAFAIARGPAGSVYLAGVTQSADFPVQGAPLPSPRGFADAFVTKLGPDGELLYSTYLGGSRDDGGLGLAVDGSGSAYVTGYVWSPDFPTASALQPILQGDSDAFVTKLSPSGSALVYSTYLGTGNGLDLEGGAAIAVDGSGNAYVARSAWVPNRTGGGEYSSTVVKLDSRGSQVLYQKELFPAEPTAIAVDASGHAYLTGSTRVVSAFPFGPQSLPTVNALQPSFGCGESDGFVAKLQPDGASFAYCTYLGGSGVDAAQGIAVDEAGNAYVTGNTESDDFPLVNPLQPTRAGSSDAFVAKLNEAGSALAYSTYLGGSGSDQPTGIAIDPARNAWVAGGTQSTDFPTAHALQLGNAGGPSDAFVATLAPSGASLVQATYLGGRGNDKAYSVAVDGLGNAYLAGTTESTDFPTQHAAQVQPGGSIDAFVAGLLLRFPPLWQPFFAVDRLETPAVGDFDGDGKTDIITFTRQNPLALGDVYVSLSTGTSFGPASKWNDFFAINTDEQVVIGDYDGDGKDDIATWLSVSTRQVYVALSFGTGMATSQVWEDSIGFGPSDVLAAGDANGDGRKDLILFARTLGKVYVALSEGMRFGTPKLWHDFFAVSTYERPEVADVNGDGKADIVTFATDSPTAFGDVYVATSDGARFGDGHNSTKWHDFFAIRPTETVRTADLDGDGKADFFTFLPPPFGQCYTVISQGNQMGPNVLWREVVVPGATDLPFAGDVDGDGKADIIVFAQGEGKVYVSVAP